MKILSMVLFLSVVCYAELPILQTGQTKVYSSGDNGTHQTGAKRSYAKQGEVVIDNTTGLMWQNEPYTPQEKEAYDKTNGSEYGKVLKWGNAFKYCEALELEGYSDWRLPSLKELKSLVDYSRTNPSIDDNVFKVMPNYYWSSTLYASDDDNAWVVHFGNGYDHYGPKDTSNYVRCVRGQ